MTFVVDAEWKRVAPRQGGGGGVFAGSPPVWFAVTVAGAEVLDAIEHGDSLPAGHEPLTSRLLARGAIHPLPGDPIESSRLTVVIPARIGRGDSARLDLLVARLSPLRVVVVDDRSDQPLVVAGADVIAHDGTAGPGPARNTGLARVTTEFVAFVDADATVDPADLLGLASLLERDTAALAAPRVASADTGRNRVYEASHSPLDLGPVRSLVRPGSRLSYVPAAVLVARADAIRGLGGFDESLRWGEDVDLVWRTVQAGLACRYEPSVIAEHAPRATLRRFCAQRFRYGTSAGPLALRHAGAVAPLRTNIPVFVTSLACLCLWWQVAAPLTAAVWAWFTVGLGRTGLPFADRGRIATRALQRAVAHTAGAVRRAWWPVVAAAAPFSARAAIALGVSFGVPVLVGLARHRPRNIPRWIALRLLDDLAYSAGVWWGALTARSPRCLVPGISAMPARAS